MSASVRRGHQPSIAIDVLWMLFDSITREMDVTLTGTAFSIGIREAHDCACALFDARGQMISQTSTAPGQLGSMPFLMRDLLALKPAKDMRDGDVFVTNDPWLGCGHTPDIYVITPLFYRGSLVAFAGNCGHHSDVGGRLAAQDSTEVFEEGILIPVTRLYSAGVENAELMALLRFNSRLPDDLTGDLRAQVAANNVALRRLTAIMEEYGLTAYDVGKAADDIVSRSETAMRSAFQEIPQGIYSGSIHLDDIDDGGTTLELKLALRVEGDGIVADFTGSSPQVARPINSVLNYTRAYVFVGLKMALASSLPTNAGSVRPLEVVAPKGTIVNPNFPAAVRWRTAVGLVIPDLVFSILATVVPRRVIAGSGTIPRWQEIFATRGASRFILSCHLMGGMGASMHLDGLSAIAWPANVREIPVELIELDTPLLVLSKGYRIDSGGAGRQRGGLGQDFVISNPLKWGLDPAEPVSCILNGGRLLEGAAGFLGGHPGARGEMRLNSRRLVRSRAEAVLLPGDTLTLRTPGGGGFGPPRERDPNALEADVKKGFVSAVSARGLYGRTTNGSAAGKERVHSQNHRRSQGKSPS